jgi:hypothetical protein
MCRRERRVWMKHRLYDEHFEDYLTKLQEVG